MNWGRDKDIPYAFHIQENDREHILKIIKKGMTDDHAIKTKSDAVSDEYFETDHLCNTENMITFNRLIKNISDVEEYITERKDFGTVLVVFGESNTYQEFKSAKKMVKFYNNEYTGEE